MRKYTPAMQQYINIKKQHQDCILFFRMGDFYETFFEDAKTTSKVLDLVLTAKNKNSENPIPMAGIPYHSIEKYIQRLIQHGYKIAIAEQTTKPQPGKIVEREVVSIITPGTYIQENNKNFSYILAINSQDYKSGNSFHIARGDFSLGEYQTKSFQNIENMQKFILWLNPTEIIFDIDFNNKDEITKILQQYNKCLISTYDVPTDPKKYITNECQIQTITSFWKALEEGRLYAFALLLNYLKNTQKTALTNIAKISLHNQNNKVLLDNVTIKNLEIFASSYENQEKYSLIWILDNTKTTGGARLLRHLLANPINNIKILNQRLNHIDHYQKDSNTTKKIHITLNEVRDIPKIATNILYKKLLPSTFIRIRSTIDIFFSKEDYLLTELLRLWLKKITVQKVEKLHTYLTQLLKSNDEINDEINFINDNYHSKIDELRKIAFHSDKMLLDYQQELIKISWVPNVKIKFIKNQGYFIEITNKDIQTFEKNLLEPSQFSRIQEQKSSETSPNLPKSKFNIHRRNTLKGNQRYSSLYLDSLEQKIFAAKEKLIHHEFELLEEAKNKIAKHNKELNEFAQKIARLDIFTSHALLAKEYDFCSPKLTQNWQITIKNGRHPVIEKFLPIDEQFIPNNLIINYKHSTSNIQHSTNLQIITGPNMWGKSTFLRQNALIVLMAHCGLHIPAQEANIGLIDGIFARVGSGDVIAKNQSTFMTEMIEVANILNNATKDSFVIFDELGRWTSTYDGLALTRAILEHITTNIGCKTLIATHYHELIKLEKEYQWVKNYSVSVYETDKEVVFMKKIVPGGANKSYGIDVAKLAGINKQITDQAEYNLNKLKNQKKSESPKSSELSPIFRNPQPQNNTKYDKIKSLLHSFDLNNITPLQALQLLSKLKDEL